MLNFTKILCYLDIYWIYDCVSAKVKNKENETILAANHHIMACPSTLLTNIFKSQNYTNTVVTYAYIQIFT